VSSVADSLRSLLRSLAGRRWLWAHRWLWTHVRRRLPALCSVLLLALINSTLSITLPYLSKLIIDRGLIGRDVRALLTLCACVVGLAALSFVIGGVTRWIYVRTSAGILFAVREQVYARLLSLTPEFYRRRPVGDLVTRLDGDVAEIQRFSTDTLLTCINGVLLLAGTAAIMLTMSWQLTLVAAAVLPIQLWVRRLARPLIRDRTRAVREQTGEVAQFLFETLSSVKAIQGVVAEEHEQKRLRGLNSEYLNRLLSLQLVSYCLGGLSGLLSHSATAAVFIYGGFRVIEGSLTVGTLVAFVAYMARGTGSAVSLLNLYTAYQRASVSLERVEELLVQETQPDCADTSQPRSSRVNGNSLSLRNVSLGRRACGTVLLADCSFEIPAGCKAIIHGPSGVGKSTLIDALRRFVPLDSGSILLGGIDIGDYELGTLRRAIEVLVSEPVIFRGTLAENLRFGNFDATEASIEDAAHRAGLIASELPSRLDTSVGTGGLGLSAGQRQRVAIARTLLRRPNVLIMDEALANLDVDAALALHEVIDAQFAACTRIVVSHSPALVPRADLIVEMRDGRLIQAPRAIRA
jgi:ATP-binding cassette, subfamily B, bacterial